MTRPKIPDICAKLDREVVVNLLVKHHASTLLAARELGIPARALRRLTWAHPKLLEAAHEEMALSVDRARSKRIRDLDSSNRRQQERAVDKLLASWEARDSPLAPAWRGRRPRAQAHLVEARVEVVAAPPMSDIEADAIAEVNRFAEAQVDPDRDRDRDRDLDVAPIHPVLAPPLRAPAPRPFWQPCEIFDGRPELRGVGRSARLSRRNTYA